MPWKNGNPPLYSVWRSMLFRCYVVKHNKQWKDYGGRGIKVCAQWRTDFKQFIADMGPRPTPKHTLDRINNNGNYAPENCRWATRKEQQRNQSVTRKVTIEGKEYIAAELSEEFCIKTDVIVARAKKGLPFSSITKKGHLRFYARPDDTHCVNGHEFTPENIRILPSGKRACRACLKVLAQKRYLSFILKEKLRCS